MAVSKVTGNSAHEERAALAIEARLSTYFHPALLTVWPDERLQVFQALMVRRAQIVEARKRLSTQISACRKQAVSPELEDTDSNLKAFIESQFRRARTPD